MTHDARPGEHDSPGRRPGRTAIAVVATLLILGGGAAVAAGVLDQDAEPPAPAATQAAPTGTRPAPAGSATASTAAGVPAPTATPTPSATATPVARPASLSIPAIDVESELITVGLNPDGTLEVPQPGPDYDKAAWYDGSPRPGQVGPAVIEGHVDSAENGPSVFYELGALTSGDQVDVRRTDGSTATFEVYDVRIYPKDEFPTLEVYGNTETPELRLITCGGPFDSSSGHYVDNTVVFARQVGASA